ncbi:hypothetical protein F4779DRAFT_618266 [Xylariaceae sp. FL0662B]|nr:hypothetical protein F4779DRAFT_618266 [Xylariaceae sp. FL0662B]
MQSSSPFFERLPPELRNMIWKLALPDDVPEVCLPEQPIQVGIGTGALFVNTAYPMLMHLCSESRKFAMSEARFVYSRDTDCRIAIRDFRPDFDVLQITAGTGHLPKGDDGVAPETSVAHLALDAHEDMSSDELYMVASMLLHRYTSLKTLAFIFHTGAWKGLDFLEIPRHQVISLARHLTRRRRLQPIVDWDSRWSSACQKLKSRIDATTHAELLRFPEDVDGSTWNSVDHCFKFEVMALTLLEYRLIGKERSWIVIHPTAD